MEVKLEHVSKNLAQLRAKRGFSLRELADLTGYTSSYLSQIERGESVPSLSGLATVAAALGVELVSLFEAAEGPRVSISRADDRLQLSTTASDDAPAHRYSILGAHGSNRSYSVLSHSLPPGEDPIEYRHFGERFCLILTGTVELILAGETHTLNAGDWIHYASHQAHMFGVKDEEGAEVLWIVSPAIF